MEISVIQAVLLGLMCSLISTGLFPLGWISMNIMSKPLISCFFIGLIMRDMKTAMIIGCVIQSAYIGQMSIGGVSTLPAINTSLWFALPLTMVSGGSAAECLAICLAYAGIETVMKSVGNLIKVAFLHMQDGLVEKGEVHKAWWFPVLGHVWTFVYCMVAVTGLCLAGSGIISSVVSSLPTYVTSITNIFISLLPSIGFMILIVTLIQSPWQWIFFVFGFMSYKSLGWSTISLTVFGCVIAYMIFLFKPSSKTVTETVVVEEEEL